MAEYWSIPLTLRPAAPGFLVLSLPGWYRWLMAAILGVAAAALLQVGGWPGLPAWLLLGLVAVALLYEERWRFDAARGRVVHRSGLLVAARTLEVPFAAIDRFRIVPHVEGTIPGSEDERRENAAALAGGRGDDAAARRRRHRKPFLALVLECGDGSVLLIDRVPARQLARLRGTAARLADFCGKPLAVADL